jgi:hypothetical protein
VRPVGVYVVDSQGVALAPGSRRQPRHPRWSGRRCAGRPCRGVRTARASLNERLRRLPAPAARASRRTQRSSRRQRSPR